jgi:hypothetical protein
MPKTTKKMTTKRLILPGVLVLLLILVGGVLLLPYLIQYFVSPELLIRNTTQALEELTGAEIEIGQAQLSVIEGVTFHEVRVLLPKDKRKLEPGFDPQDALLLQAKTLHVKLRRKGLLGLSFRLGEIAVDKPEFHLTRLQAEGKWNWQLLFAEPASAPATQPTFNLGPPIILNNGKIILTDIQSDGRRCLGEIRFDAQARPKNHNAFYRLDLQTRSEQAPGPKLSLDFDHHNGHVLSGRVDPITLNNLQHFLPEPGKGWLKQLRAAGEIAVTEIRYAPPSPLRVVLTLNKVRTKVPLTRQEFDLDAKTAFVNLSKMNGRIILDGDELACSELTGKLNDAPCTIDGRLPINADPADAPFDLRLACTGFVIPEYTDPATRKYIDAYLPWRLRKFFSDFKAIGLADFDLACRRDPDLPFGFVLNGQIMPQHCSAEYFKFPYRVNNITGSVDITDNRFHLNNLTGSTNPGIVVVSGTISDPSNCAEITLKIESTRTVIDDKLLQALSPQDQKIFNQFNPTGFADTHIELHNPPGFQMPWETAIDADFTDTSALYDKFPYPVDHLQGRLTIRNNKLELKNITGRHRSARFTLNGTIENPKSPSPVVQLDLAAKNVPIDDALASALPAATRQIVQNCRLTGTTDIEGSLTQQPGSPLDYTIRCDLDNAGLQPREFPYPLTNMNGRLILTPQTVVIDNIHTENGDQTIAATGRVDFRDHQSETALEITAQRLPLDDALFEALPPTAQEVWNHLNPKGKIDVRAVLNFKPNQPWSGDVKLNLLDAAVSYKTLAPITGLWGQVAFTPERIELKNITGKVAGKAPLWLAGSITNTPKSTQVDMTQLEVKDVPIDKGLLETLVGKSVTDRFQWTPGGTATCRLGRVRTDLLSDNSRKWQITGQMHFQDVRMALFDESPTRLDYTGDIAWLAPKGEFALDGQLDLKTLNWNGRQVENIQAQLKKPLDSILLNVDPLSARYAQGQISGIAKLKFLDKETRYGLQLTVDNLDAGTAIGIKEGKESISGRMKGELYLEGTVGQKYSRLGGGVLQITGAEVFKVPLMARIYEKLRHEPPNLATFHDVTARFALEKYKVNFLHIELIGPTLSLIGSGDLNISNDRLNLDLVAGSPQSLKNVPLLPELMQGASREISQIEIHGKTDNPTITVRPLKDISDTVKSFFNGKTVH